MYSLLFKDFLRSKAIVAGVGLLLFAGLLSTYVGGVFLDREADTLAQAAEAQQEGIERTLDFVADDDLGLFLYYVRFGLVNETPRLAGLSVGHRDVHAATQNVTIRFLEEQRHGSVLNNPLFQLLGYLDFNFVLIFLFPLVVIGFCFDIWSEEREGGTWSLVTGQSARPEKVLWAKWLLRFGVVQGTLLFLLLVAKLYLAIPVDGYFAAFVAVAVAYLSFWCSLSWLVVRLGYSSSQSALSLLVAWVLLTIVVPSGLSALVEVLYPTPEAYEAMLLGRDGYHDKWDKKIEPTLDRFKAIYPQYASYDHPDGASFSWVWYYAMQHLGDVEAAPAAEGLRQKLARRAALSRAIAYLLPTVHTQLSFNALSRSDLGNHLAFQDALREFHAAKRLSFYDKIFNGTSVSSEDWGQYESEVFRDSRPVGWLSALLPLLLASGILLAISRSLGPASGPLPRWITLFV